MCIFFILVSSGYGSHFLMAQENEDWKGSVSAFVRPQGLFGLGAEYFVGPQASVWAEAGFINFTKTSVFRNEDLGQGFPIEDFGTFRNVQVQQSYRAGLRYYLDPIPDKWGFFVSTFGGFTNISEPSSEFLAALQNPNVLVSGYVNENRIARQQLELGGELGMRFTVFSHYFLEASYQGFIERSLKDDDHDATFSTKLTIGYTF